MCQPTKRREGEETMFTRSIGTITTSPESSVARRLQPDQRLTLALEALQRKRPLTQLAQSQGVSRKFVYAQQRRAETAAAAAFLDPAPPEDFLGLLPVTRSWIRRLIVSSALSAHASVRGICDHVEAVTGRAVSEGTVVNVLREAVGRADALNRAEDLRTIREGAHDEIFSQDVPVLVGVDPRTTFVYLLELSSSRDELSWWAALTDKHERQGLDLSVSLSDAAQGLRAGVKAAFPQIELRGDVFHAQKELSELDTYLENRAYARMAYEQDEERKMARAKRRDQGHKRSKRLAVARAEAKRVITRYDEIHTLVQWLIELLELVGPDLAQRRELYDWIVGEMEARAPQSHRIGPVVTYFRNQRDELLAFVADLQRGLSRIAQTLHVSQASVQAVYLQFALDPEDPRYEALERQLLADAPDRTEEIFDAVADLLDATLRASSSVENINSILRPYFFLRRSIGPEFLSLLQFYLNHRRFRRSEHPERVGKSPQELLSGRPHPHWLEMLGYPPVALLN